MSTRLDLIPDERLAALKSAFQDRIRQIAAVIEPENFGSVCPPVLFELLRQAFQVAGADEGRQQAVLWIGRSTPEPSQMGGL